MYEKEIKAITKVVNKVAKKIILPGASTKTKKGDFDYATDKDIASEKYFIYFINKHFPKDNIISEESNYKASLTDRTWIIDPIDGTFNYMHRLNIFGIQLAFYDQGETQFSIIYLPYTKEFYFAKNGNGSYLNGKQIFVNKDVEIKDSRVVISNIAHSLADETRKKMAETFCDISQKTLSILEFGASSFTFAKIASSNLSAYIITTSKKWDILPGMLICKEAGCYTEDGQIGKVEYHIASCNENLGKYLSKSLLNAKL